MDITNTVTTPNTNTLTIKTTHQSDFDISPPKNHLSKPLSFTNGVVVKHNSNTNVKPNIPVVVNYKECLKNHAATLGGHALDGCGEFMPSPSAVPTDPTSLKCAACGCHRNFHRRDPDDSSLTLPPKNTFIEYQPHHRHRPPPPDSPNSMSPPPISSSYPPSAPHMLLALSDGLLAPQNNNHHNSAPIAHIRVHPNGRKRFRTKFSQQQKEKMFGFAERVGWKIPKRDEDIINFCSEIGVDRSVLKVWMHNNKSTLGKRDCNNIINNNVNGNTNYNVNNNGGGGNQVQQEQLNNIQHSDSTGSPLVGGANVATNGNVSSSSS
ncbi:hypothetical protein AgCh_015162 [Apium graveolens]